VADAHIQEATRIIEAASGAQPAIIRSFFDEATFTVTHVLSDPVTGKAAIIDSVLDFDFASARTCCRSAAPCLQQQLGGTLALTFPAAMPERSTGPSAACCRGPMRRPRIAAACMPRKSRAAHVHEPRRLTRAVGFASGGGPG